MLFFPAGFLLFSMEAYPRNAGLSFRSSHKRDSGFWFLSFTLHESDVKKFKYFRLCEILNEEMEECRTRVLHIGRHW